MSARRWLEAAGYACALLKSGLEGTRAGREAFLDGQPLTPFLQESARQALCLGLIGGGMGVLGASLSRSPKSAGRRIACGIAGGMIGLGAGLTWGTHQLAGSMARGAFKSMEASRDAHWLKKHPIDYA